MELNYLLTNIAMMECYFTSNETFIMKHTLKTQKKRKNQKEIIFFCSYFFSKGNPDKRKQRLNEKIYNKRQKKARREINKATTKVIYKYHCTSIDLSCLFQYAQFISTLFHACSSNLIDRKLIHVYISYMLCVR